MCVLPIFRVEAAASWEGQECHRGKLEKDGAHVHDGLLRGRPHENSTSTYHEESNKAPQVPRGEREGEARPSAAGTKVVHVRMGGRMGAPDETLICATTLAKGYRGGDQDTAGKNRNKRKGPSGMQAPM